MGGLTAGMRMRKKGAADEEEDKIVRGLSDPAGPDYFS